jgi:hypothetical protein
VTPSAAPLAPPLAALPLAVRTLLAWGGVGKQHLARTARSALKLAERAWPGLARRLFLAAWECDPLDGALARAVRSQPGEPLPPALAALLDAVALGHAPPADMKYFSRLAARRDHDKLRHYLGQQRARQPGNLFWLGHELTHHLATGDFGGASRLAGEAIPRNLSALAAKLLGDIALCQGEAAAALTHYRNFQAVYDGASVAFGRARALALLGQTDQATRVLTKLAANHPWCVNAMLALYDLIGGRARGPAELPGPVAVLLYTFNKAAEMEVTLRSLERSLENPAGSDGISRIIVLDNGSTDATPEVLRAACDRLGADRMRVVRLPVNIGAPAARNWLRREPEAAAAEFVVYMDDDVDLPSDWFSLLAAARAAYPGAGVYGCKVVDHAQPLQVQSADLHLEVLPQTPEDPEAAPATRRFEISSLHHQVLDVGQFDYLRPAASVTGCLHMFATGDLAACGDFDLRFSPSQFDDLDHDLRLLALGKVPVYQGYLSLPHLKRTGAVSGLGGAGYGAGFANQYKLHGKYSREELSRMAGAADQAVWDDYQAKWTALHDQSILP